MTRSVQGLCQLTSDEYKMRILAHQSFPRALRERVASSDLSFAYIRLGVIPNGITSAEMHKLMNLEVSKLDKNLVLPLIPSFQCSWEENQIVNWLRSERIVKKSRRAIICKKLTEDIYPPRDTLDVLTETESTEAISKLNTKAVHIAPLVWDMSIASSELCSTLGRMFDIDIGKIDSVDKLKVVLIQRLNRIIRRLRPIRPKLVGETWILHSAFNQRYLKREVVAKSFIKHVVDLTHDNAKKVFACCTFLEQGNGMGKSRLFFESWEDQKYALFILRINCSRFKETDGCTYADNDTEELVHFILELRLLESMSKLICCILYLVLDRAQDENGFLRDTENLSHSLEDLGITFEEVKDMYDSISSNAVVDEGFKAIRELIGRMKLKRQGTDEVKTVIPIIAFDEASVLSQNKFDKFDPVGTSRPKSRKGTDFDSLRLVKWVPKYRGKELDNCIFIFAESNAMLATFMEPSNCSVLEDPDTTCSLGPYIPSQTLNVYKQNSALEAGERLHDDWNRYITSPYYTRRLCSIGRPLWGALTRTGRANNMAQNNIIQLVEKQANSRIACKNHFTRDECHALAVAVTGILTTSGSTSELPKSGIVKKMMAHLAIYRSLYVSYAVEPVLAMAALRKLLANPSAILGYLTTPNALVLPQNTGGIGEFGAKILFLICLPPPRLKSPFSSVQSMFRKLLGKANFAELSMMKGVMELLRGKVCYSFFTSVTNEELARIGSDPFKILSWLVSRNAALSLPAQYPGVDFIIPIILMSGGLGCIYIQVKNINKRLGYSEILEIKGKLCEQFVTKEIPRLNIIMNVCPLIKENRFEDFGNDQESTIYLEGYQNCLGETLRRYPSIKDDMHDLLAAGRNNNITVGMNLASLSISDEDLEFRTAAEPDPKRCRKEFK